MKQLIHNCPDEESFIENYLSHVNVIDKYTGEFSAIFMGGWYVFQPVRGGLLMHQQGVSETTSNAVCILFDPIKK